MVVKAWLDLKRSPYFFLRRQAEKRLQTYSLTSLGLIFATIATAAYAWQAPQDNTPRVALLANTKPPQQEVRELMEAAPMLTTSLQATEFISPTSAAHSLTSALPEAQAEQAEPTIPSEFDQFEPTVELSSDTEIGSLTFSTDVTQDYEPISPRTLYAEGAYTLYATFSYAFMENGMAWAWIWRHNGEVVGGGNELWAYGEDGPGYIFFNPEEGFQAGEYSLEVWVNGKLFTRSSVTMDSIAASAGN
jgi:hypothetical protein